MPSKRFRIYFPWHNLGCIGVQIGRFYADVYLSSRGFPWFAVFINTGNKKYWISRNGIRKEGL